METIRLLWVVPPERLVGLTAAADESVLGRGVVESSSVPGFPGPPGRHRLVPDEVWRTLIPEDPAPVLLHEAYEVLLEKWVNSLPDAAAEVAIVVRVRDAVVQLVETRLAAEPQAFSVSPTVTTTEPTPQGMAVVGRSVLLRPARGARQRTPTAARPLVQRPDR
jgi:hypothetical protein